VEGSIDLSTAAKLVSVSKPSVKRAKAVIEHGTSELQKAVEQAPPKRLLDRYCKKQSFRGLWVIRP